MNYYCRSYPASFRHVDCGGGRKFLVPEVSSHCSCKFFKLIIFQLHFVSAADGVESTALGHKARASSSKNETSKIDEYLHGQQVFVTSECKCTNRGHCMRGPRWEAIGTPAANKDLTLKRAQWSCFKRAGTSRVCSQAKTPTNNFVIVLFKSTSHAAGALQSAGYHGYSRG